MISCQYQYYGCMVTVKIFVIPAKAGIQTLFGLKKIIWIPAFAGMTDRERTRIKAKTPFFLLLP